MAQDYNQEYWDKKIQGYSQQSWMNGPSPFAKLAQEYFPSGSKILELGAGVGADSLWFASRGHVTIITDATDTFFPKIRQKLLKLNPEVNERVDLRTLDVLMPFEIDDASLDVVYAHLILHYFDNDTMKRIISEISRVLKPGGVLACLVNSQDDEEYDKNIANSEDVIDVNGISKRFYTTESLNQFTGNFETLLLHNKGRTPKDDAVGNSGLIQFIGTKKQEVK